MKITVPISVNAAPRYDKDELLRVLRMFSAEEVFLTFTKTGFDPYTETEKAAEVIREYLPFLTRHGYRVSVWLAALSGLPDNGYQRMTDIDGGTDCPLFCPLDRRYADDFCAFIRKLLSLGVRSVVLDDDFRMQLCGTKAMCFCRRHLDLYGKILNESVTRERMKEMLFAGAPNRYRDAWTQGCQQGLEEMAQAIRSTADAFGEDTRVLLCAGPALFGADGTDAYRLSSVFAGRNGEPELRLIGAPYWEKMFSDNMLSAVDFARRQAHECKKRGIRTIGEGDPFPRPRYAVSASMLEVYHTVTLADGNFDGLMKYGIDYLSSLQYERGYAQYAEENKPLYREIETLFDGKRCAGVNPVEPFDRIAVSCAVSESPEMDVIVSATRNFVNILSLPSAPDAGGVNIVFGENARCLDPALLKNGTVLDLGAAEILRNLGIDVGLAEDTAPASAEEAESEFVHLTDSYYEEFSDERERVLLGARPHCREELRTADAVSVLSYIYINGKTCIGSYTYENRDGARFLVYNFRMRDDISVPGLIAGYCRQNQFIRLCRWLNGTSLPASCAGNPYLYLLVKRNGNAMSVGLWNYFRDKTLNRTVILHRPYRHVRFVGCSGTLDGNTVTLDAPLGAYESCYFEVSDS